MAGSYRYSFEDLLRLNEGIPEDADLELIERQFRDHSLENLLELLREEMTAEGFALLLKGATYEPDKDWIVLTLAMIRYIEQQPKN